VTSAALGARDIEKFGIGFFHALKLGLILTGALSIITYFFAPQIILIFTWSKGSAGLSDDLLIFFRMFSWFYMSITIWTTSVCFLIGLGFSIFDFLFNFVKQILLVLPLCYVLGVIFSFGLVAIWAVIIVSMWVQALLAFALVLMFLRKYQGKAG
jgi:Na+-driven multidrug efflux pump